MNRELLCHNNTIILTEVGGQNRREFEISDVIGQGGTSVVYKAIYHAESAYSYVLKECYPLSLKIKREGEHLVPDEKDSESYKEAVSRFIEAYNLEKEIVMNDTETLLNFTTSVPLGIYEDSDKKKVYGTYTLFPYIIRKTLSNFRGDSSLAGFLTEICIHLRLAEIVRAYENKGFIWIDITESNIGVYPGVLEASVMMFDFSSLINIETLRNYNYDPHERSLFLSFTCDPREVLLPYELETLLKLVNEDNLYTDRRTIEECVRGIADSRSDIFLLGSMLFKRLMDRAPTRYDCDALENDRFDLSQSSFYEYTSNETRFYLVKVLKSALIYEDSWRRSEIDQYISLLKTIISKELPIYISQNSNENTSSSNSEQTLLIPECFRCLIEEGDITTDMMYNCVTNGLSVFDVPSDALDQDSLIEIMEMDEHFKSDLTNVINIVSDNLQCVYSLKIFLSSKNQTLKSDVVSAYDLINKKLIRMMTTLKMIRKTNDGHYKLDYTYKYVFDYLRLKSNDFIDFSALKNIYERFSDEELCHEFLKLSSDYYIGDWKALLEKIILSKVISKNDKRYILSQIKFDEGSQIKKTCEIILERLEK